MTTGVSSGNIDQKCAVRIERNGASFPAGRPDVLTVTNACEHLTYSARYNHQYSSKSYLLPIAPRFYYSHETFPGNFYSLKGATS